MHLDEAAFVVVAEGGASGAVGFVADDEVEVSEPMAVLGTTDDFDGVVGAEDHAHVRGVVSLGHFGGQAGWLGRGRVAQLVGEGLDAVVVFLAFLADVAV